MSVVNPKGLLKPKFGVPIKLNRAPGSLLIKVLRDHFVKMWLIYLWYLCIILQFCMLCRGEGKKSSGIFVSRHLMHILRVASRVPFSVWRVISIPMCVLHVLQQNCCISRTCVLSDIQSLVPNLVSILAISRENLVSASPTLDRVMWAMTFLIQQVNRTTMFVIQSISFISLMMKGMASPVSIS